MLVLNLRLIKTKERTISFQNVKTIKTGPQQSWVSRRTTIERRREDGMRKLDRVIVIADYWTLSEGSSVWRAGWSWACWPWSGPPAPTCPPTVTSTSSVPASSSPAWASRTLLRTRLLSRPSSRSSRHRWTSGTSPVWEFLSLKYQVGLETVKCGVWS